MQLQKKKKKNNPIQKLVEDLNRHFSKDIYMAKKDIKRHSTSLILREMQTKTIVRYHHTLVRKAIIERFTNNKFLRGCREKGTFQHCWNVNWYHYYEKQFRGSFKNSINNYHMIQQSHSWTDIQRKPYFKKMYALQCLLQHHFQ